jgi:glycosyltransferase involved in cell wall biosynthesis
MSARARTVEIVIPCLNEEEQLPVSLERLRTFCTRALARYARRITVADNGSRDRTFEIAQQVRARHPGEVHAIRLEERGRGRALRRAWTESRADIVAYMDVDLSTGLEALPPLIDAIGRDGYDIAVGSRLATGARVEGRTVKREILSRVYNLMIKGMFFTRFTDAQCGFKALSRRAADELLAVATDTGWFLDSELLIIAEKRGYRIKDIAVHWRDDPDSRVKIVQTAWRDIQGLMRLRFGGIPDPRRADAPDRRTCASV